MWCSVPLRTYPDEPEDGGGGNTTWPWDGFPWNPPHQDQNATLQPSSLIAAAITATAGGVAAGFDGGALSANLSNLSANLTNMLPTTPPQPAIFNIYSLNWWPKALGGLTSYFIFWLSTQLMGILVYYFTGLESYRLTWVFLTFCTMTMPLLIAFLVIRSENRNVYRHSLTMAQKTFLSASSIESRIPASYIRFLWFCVALAIALSTIVTGEMYADQFQAPRTTPHTTIEDWCMCIRGTYEEYKRQVGRGLFLRNLAENVTMLAFLLWKVDGTPCHKGGPQDFKEYPELIVVFILVMIHILQDMLLSLLDLNFA
ncbi:hypothetical protein BCR41DRAFT_398104 [Lobosporangium transversale]|uniref:Uncharacterized protein n=1 Tax=Lobosporangium transversale TaxID=64571 RepID=A0A1Y2GHA1_9FUNG|nr:hypothetical protein BCR41DRAFT_398104 [Lobosporangium transversale]ORZ10928.1 hypothetical protein BCR41DRAFT_398104 [Lobosporangium transversale]|eukprot:XP_021879445.1 hypothetical protein BCR41DRAFT_398104 [Lobosporangium transversale]